MSLAPYLAALPWLAVPVVLAWRMRGGPSLDRVPAAPPADPPLVSVIIPARDEARNIARCAHSVLASAYPALEVVVVNDRSEDGTGIIARELARRDARLTVIDAPPLPTGWFGKPWACATGAAKARGSVLCFTDADTVHGRELLPRAVNEMRERQLDLLTVAGRQEMVGFWERVVQPQVFTLLALRYGGPRAVNRSSRVVDKIANGQLVIFTRQAYDALGGHAAVRGKVAEDLALAQRSFALGQRTEVALGLRHLTTRMYTTLGEIVRGWMKNIYAGAHDATPLGAPGRALLPLMLLAPIIAMLAPPVTLVLAALGVVGSGVTTWALATTAVSLAWWAIVYVAAARLSPAYAFAYPLGAVVVGYIILRAVARGERVEWKGREYTVARE